MKYVIYLIAGIIFSIGLSLSGMIDPLKVKGFLSYGFADWNPALLFVLGSAFPVYLLIFFFLRRREKTLNGNKFEHPRPRPVDRRLVIGSLLFGVGWGIAGICPGPAIVHLSFLDIPFVIFILTMFLGFELQRRFT